MSVQAEALFLAGTHLNFSVVFLGSGRTLVGKIKQILPQLELDRVVSAPFASETSLPSLPQGAAGRGGDIPPPLMLPSPPPLPASTTASAAWGGAAAARPAKGTHGGSKRPLPSTAPQQQGSEHVHPVQGAPKKPRKPPPPGHTMQGASAPAPALAPSRTQAHAQAPPTPSVKAITPDAKRNGLPPGMKAGGAAAASAPAQDPELLCAALGFKQTGNRRRALKCKDHIPPMPSYAVSSMRMVLTSGHVQRLRGVVEGGEKHLQACEAARDAAKSTLQQLEQKRAQVQQKASMLQRLLQRNAAALVSAQAAADTATKSAKALSQKLKRR